VARNCLFQTGFAVRRLQPPLDPLSVKKLIEFEVIGRPFDFSLLNSRRSARRSHQGFTGESYICSSLVAASLQKAGILRSPADGTLPNNVLPVDFAANGSLPLSNGYSFEREEIIKDTESAKASLTKTGSQDLQF
jgi:hypothetical protein